MHAAASCASMTMEEATPREDDDTPDEECFSLAADLPQDILAKVRRRRVRMRPVQGGNGAGRGWSRQYTNGSRCACVGAMRCCFCQQ